MLRAEQAALEQHGKAELLRILEREFQYYKSSFDSVGTQAALMAGFTVAVLVTLETPNDEFNPTLVKTYHILAFVCLMSLIFTIVSVTTVIVWGPQLALRGASPTSMETAVRGVKGARWEIYISFFLGVITFLLMTVTVAWIQMKESVATICSGCAFLTTVLIFRNGYVTKMTFRMMPSSQEPSRHGVHESDNSSLRDSTTSSRMTISEQPHSRWKLSMQSSSRQPLMEEDHGNHHHGTTSIRDTLGSNSFSIRRSSTASAPVNFMSPNNNVSNNTNNSTSGPQSSSMKTNTTTTTTTDGNAGTSNSNISSTTTFRDSNLSNGDHIDNITTQLLNNGGGWLLKKGQRSFGGEQWKKRWVTIQKGSLYYDKTRPLENNHSNKIPLTAKLIPLSNKVTIGIGSDGKTLRLTSILSETADAEQVIVADWRCDTQDERDAWTIYIKSGITVV